jgi:putative intracellular protease/amidase
MNIVILIYPGMTARDVVGPYEVLNLIPDAKIQFVWKEVGPVMSDSGAS